MCQMFAGQDPATDEYETRSLRLNGQSTSIRLERAFWNVLTDIAQAEKLSTPQFLSRRPSGSRRHPVATGFMTPTSAPPARSPAARAQATKVLPAPVSVAVTKRPSPISASSSGPGRAA